MGSMTRRGLLALVLLGAAALVPAGCGGDKPKSIKVVIAEYSRDHTRPFWQGLAEQYTKQTGVKVDLQVIDWNSIDQQVSTMIQNNQPPDVLNLNSFSSYAKDGLLYSGDEALSPRRGRTSSRPSRRAAPTATSSTASRSWRARAPSSTTRPARQGRRGRAAPDLGRARPGGQAGAGAGGGTIGYALPLAPRRRRPVVDLDVEQRRGLEGGEAWAINSEKNVQTPSSSPRSPTPTR